MSVSYYVNETVWLLFDRCSFWPINVIKYRSFFAPELWMKLHLSVTFDWVRPSSRTQQKSRVYNLIFETLVCTHKYLLMRSVGFAIGGMKFSKSDVSYYCYFNKKKSFDVKFSSLARWLWWQKSKKTTFFFAKN